MLVNCSALAMGRYEYVAKNLKNDTKLLVELRKDLDYVFRRIRAIKTRLVSQYPDAFKGKLKQD